MISLSTRRVRFCVCAISKLWFGSRVFGCACEMFSHSTELRVAHLSFVHRYVSIQRARVLARTLLRVHSADLRLWHAYAEMERRHGNLDEVRPVPLCICDAQTN